jgi:hypothetical protein
VRFFAELCAFSPTAGRSRSVRSIIYKAANPPVAGIGFAATRDIVSFARYATADDAGTPNR